MKINDFVKNKQSKQKPVNPQEAINQYSKMSGDELHKELLKEGSVSSGKVTSEQLDDFFTKANPYLNREQRSKMAKLIDELKKS